MIYFIIAVAIIMLETIITSALKRKYQNELFDALDSNDYKKFDEIINKKTVRYIFTPFNIEYMKLSKALCMGNNDIIAEELAVICAMRLSENQKQTVYLKAFDYYISIKDLNSCEKYYSLIKTLKNEDIKKDADVLHDIYCLNGYKYLDDILRLYSNSSDKQKLYYGYLLSIMYNNKGDIKKSKEYEKLSKK